MILLRTLGFFAVLALLTSCAGVPQASDQYLAHLLAPAQSSRLIVYRYRSEPYIAKVAVTVAGQKLKLPNNCFAVFDVAPGTHRIRADWAWDTAMPDRELELSVKSGESRFIKIDSTAGRLESITMVGTLPLAMAGASNCEIHEIPSGMAKSELPFTRLTRN